MVQATPFLLVLLLALGAHGLQDTQQCNLTGKWKNNLGSNMTINEVKKNGDFTGTYFTAVSDVPSEIEESPLVGSQRLPSQLNQPTFGFTVHWNFTDTISVFTGQCFVEKNQEVLKTMWLLRLRVKESGDDWKATRVGYNIFKRLKHHKD